MAARVGEHPLRRRRQLHARLRLAEEQALVHPAALHGGPQEDGDAPALVGAALRAEISEAALRELDPRPVGLDGHQRITRPEDPGVHDLGDGLARCLAERLPEIGGLGIAVAMLF